MPPMPILLAIWLLLVGAAVAQADLLEFVNGAKVEGEITARDDASVTILTKIGERTYTRKWATAKLHAITIDGRREVLNPKASGKTSSGGSRTATGPASPRRPAPADQAKGDRTRDEVEALIDSVGRTQPEWWDSVPLNYPQSLDLSWPTKPPGNWNNQRNVGQYIWDVINTNPNKWREGVRFVHHLLTVNKDNAEVRARAMNEMGRMYYGLLQDYPRAAFWWRAAGADKGEWPHSGVSLAECYWKLGNKEMAAELLTKLPTQFSMIKLLADMGELRRALALAEANTRGPYADLAYLYAGDACRVSGEHSKAVQYYEKVLQLPASGRFQNRIARNQQRARANVEAIRLFDTLDLARVPDGVYRGNCLGYEAPVHVEVTVRQGRIESVRVTEHHEKQFYAAMTETPQKILDKQSVRGIDATSNATLTSQAIINATAKALASGMK